MDPFIEGQKWPDFHVRFITAISESLVPKVRPKYEVNVEERIYVEHQGGEPRVLRPDVSLSEREPETFSTAPPKAETAVIEPALLTLPIAEPEKEAYLLLRHRETGGIVTILELLSPGNKRFGSDGRLEYLSKREVIVKSQTHLVELDLLRNGQRLPTIEPLPPGDFYAFVRRSQRRYKVEVYGWALGDRLPSIPVPLAGDDPDVSLNLQAVLDTVYDRAGYDYSLDYRRRIEPALTPGVAACLKPLLDQA